MRVSATVVCAILSPAKAAPKTLPQYPSKSHYGKFMKSRSWLYVITACVGLTIVLAVTKGLQIKKAIEFGKAFPEPMETVELAMAIESYWQPTVSVTADVTAIQSIDLRNEMGGRVAKIGPQYLECRPVAVAEATLFASQPCDRHGPARMAPATAVELGAAAARAAALLKMIESTASGTR